MIIITLHIFNYFLYYFPQNHTLKGFFKITKYVIFHPLYIVMYFTMFAISLGLAIFIYKQSNGN